jgi:hypothetical protein
MVANTGLLLAAALVTGCGAQSGDFGKHSTSPATTAATRPIAKAYRFDERAAFITDMSAELAVITREFDRLFPRVGAASSQVQGEVVPTIESLRGLSGTLYRRLDEARTATEAEWPALTASFRQDLGSLKDGLEQSRQKLSGPALQ